ncbi:hypothetical protein [Shewanella sp.]|uniref:hypothetical protein n=1 Tax=Shewanella sp. TaxID=50422 RepID=UPI0040485D1E
MAASGITILHKCKLTPITLEELMEYSFYALYQLSYLADTARFGQSPDMYSDWDNSDEQREFVINSHLWKTVNFIWEYAEKGMHIEKLNEAYVNDLLVDLYKWGASCDSVLLHDGSFGHETLEVREAGSKLAYKFLARIKLDLGWNIDHAFPAASLYPMTHETKLSTVEYALLAGLSHVGAVRNEASSKSDQLITEKIGNNILIPVEVARHRLPKKRKFVSTQGVNYDSAN